MKVLIRKTLTGAEYWDTKAKRTLFVPKGEKPDFQVADSVDSMIGGGESPHTHKMIFPDPIGNDLDEMNADQLRAFAKDNDIELPFNVKKEETIRKRIQEALDADDEQ
ncbi:hypothetical protein [Lederbergia galactosidilytica]|uniref:Uncharacterized protein n=1 Tax=Lederbergia galactosidilytica TaxID=217031 RepID=A0A177ZXU6_9BACI|nr:hypothetical protein [Lederbergia galactosidilytica]OAK72674.1 hypothetical protein ABB05_07395 [Lederbergia galactosidilytica]